MAQVLASRSNLLLLVEAMNTELVAHKFDRMGAMAIDAEPVMQEMIPIMMEVMGKNFESQGRRGGGSWREITPQWLARKMRNNQDPRILHATLALRESVTVPGAPHQRIQTNREWVRIDSLLDYSYAQNRERPFTRFLPSDILQMRLVIKDYLMSAWRDLKLVKGTGKKAARRVR